MMNLANKQLGFSFIEITIALTLLSIFGTSLFVSQSTVLTKLIRTHLQVVQSGDGALALQQLHLKMAQAALKKEDSTSVKVSLTLQNPEREIAAQLQPISEKSSLYKTFAKKVRLVKITSTLNGKQHHVYALQHIPQLNPKASKKDDNSVTPQNAPKGTIA